MAGVVVLALALAAVGCGGGAGEGGGEDNGGNGRSETTRVSSGVERYVLPGEQVFPEGVAYQSDTGDFYVGSTTDGTVFRGNVEGGPKEARLEEHTSELQSRQYLVCRLLLEKKKKRKLKPLVYLTPSL